MRACNPNLRVTWLTRRRLSRVLQIERLCFGEHAWTHDEFIGVLSQRSCVGMIVTDMDDSLLGYMVYELHPQCYRILNIAVDPLAQRDGAGAAMVAKLAGKLDGDRRTRIVTTVRGGNHAARMFFAAMWFRVHRWIERPYEGSDKRAMVYVLTLDNWVRYVNAAMAIAADLDDEEVAS